MSDNKITIQEKKFCEYYMKGVAPYAGNAALCYLKAFAPEITNPTTEEIVIASVKATELFVKEEIREYMDILTVATYKENEAIKRYIAESLKAIINETSTAQYRDRRGAKLSPAPLRSVAVSAAKALAELYPVKATQTHQLNIGDGEAGVTFNLIVPNKTNNEPKESE